MPDQDSNLNPGNAAQVAPNSVPDASSAASAPAANVTPATSRPAADTATTAEDFFEVDGEKYPVNRDGFSKFHENWKKQRGANARLGSESSRKDQMIASLNAELAQLKSKSSGSDPEKFAEALLQKAYERDQEAQLDPVQKELRGLKRELETLKKNGASTAQIQEHFQNAKNEIAASYEMRAIRSEWETLKTDPEWSHVYNNEKLMRRVFRDVGDSWTGEPGNRLSVRESLEELVDPVRPTVERRLSTVTAQAEKNRAAVVPGGAAQKQTAPVSDDDGEFSKETHRKAMLELERKRRERRAAEGE